MNESYDTTVSMIVHGDPGPDHQITIPAMFWHGGGLRNRRIVQSYKLDRDSVYLARARTRKHSNTCIEVYADHIIITGDDRNGIASIKRKCCLYWHFQTKERTLVNLGIVGYKRDQIKLIRILFLSIGDTSNL